MLATAERVRPRHIVHQLTALPRKGPNRRRLGRDLAATNRLRREATRHLVEAAELVEAERLVTESIAFAYRPVGPRQRGASNRRARAELGWQPRHPAWREGFQGLEAAETA